MNTHTRTHTNTHTRTHTRMRRGGATVQVNVSLSRPVRVGDVLRVVGKVVKRDRRKITITAFLDDADGNRYAELEGLSIEGVTLSKQNDAVSKRVWVAGGETIKDSGWNKVREHFIRKQGPALRSPPHTERSLTREDSDKQTSEVLCPSP